MIEDSELLRRYTEEKSEAAFTELVGRHVNLVYGCALRRVGGDAHLAKDVTQQVFIALAREARRLARREVLSGWLYTTVRNIAAQTVRTERRRQAREQKAQLMNELVSSSTHDAEWERLRPVLDDAMDHLSECDRQALLLRFFESKSFAEVGAKLRITESGARMRVERALGKMHATLARRGVTSTTAALGLALAHQAGFAAPAGIAASVASTALAGAAASGASGGAAAVFLTIMNVNKTTAGALAAIAGVLALNIGQHRANAQLRDEYQTLAAENRSLAALRAENKRLATEAIMRSASTDEAAELARLQAQVDALRTRIAARRPTSPDAGVLWVGRVAITRDTPPEQKLEIMYRDGRSSPMRAWQTLLDVGRNLAQGDRVYSEFTDLEMLALLYCFDDAARAKVEAFLAALPAEERKAFRSPERLVAPVFHQWLWKGDWPRRYGDAPSGRTDTFVAGDSTRAHTHWLITRASGRSAEESFPFQRFDDGWRYGPLSESEVEEMLTLLDPRTGQPKASAPVSP